MKFSRYIYYLEKSKDFSVGLSGLEPPTSRLSGVRSNQLSYKPTFFINLAATYSPDRKSVV